MFITPSMPQRPTAFVPPDHLQWSLHRETGVLPSPRLWIMPPPSATMTLWDLVTLLFSSHTLNPSYRHNPRHRLLFVCNQTENQPDISRSRTCPSIVASDVRGHLPLDPYLPKEQWSLMSISIIIPLKHWSRSCRHWTVADNRKKRAEIMKFSLRWKSGFGEDKGGVWWPSDNDSRNTTPIVKPRPKRKAYPLELNILPRTYHILITIRWRWSRPLLLTQWHWTQVFQHGEKGKFVRVRIRAILSCVFQLCGGARNYSVNPFLLLAATVISVSSTELTPGVFDQAVDLSNIFAHSTSILTPTFNLFEFPHQLVGNTYSLPSFFSLSLRSISFLTFRFAFLSIADLHLLQDTTSKKIHHEYSYPRQQRHKFMNQVSSAHPLWSLYLRNYTSFAPLATAWIIQHFLSLCKFSSLKSVDHHLSSVEEHLRRT